MAEKKQLELKKSWQWLVYLYLLLPLLLFLLAALTKSVTFGRLFHSYGLFIINPLPDLASKTGLVGLGIAGGLLGWAAVRRDWKDLLLSLVLVLAVAVVFWQGFNYLLLPFLRLG